MKVSNSSSGDYLLEGASLEFLAAHSILKDRCVQCHSEFNTSENQLVKEGIIVAGDALISPLYSRLKKSKGTGTKNMPPGEALNEEEILLLENWIEGVSP